MRTRHVFVDGPRNARSWTPRIPQVPVQPLLAQYGNGCTEQGDQKTCVHETGGGDNLARWIFLNGRNHGDLTGVGVLIESEEDRAEGSGLFIRVGLEIRIDIDDERGADSRERARLRGQVRQLVRADDERRTNIKVVLGSSSYFLTYSVSYSVASLLYVV